MRVKKLLHGLYKVLWSVMGPAFLLAAAVAMFIRTYNKYKYWPQYYYLYAITGDSLSWSRGTASVLCLFLSLMLLPMCRNLLAIIRNCNKIVGRVFRRLLDRNIWFHKACAVVIVVSGGIHIGAHFVNASRFSSNFSYQFPDLNFASYANQNPLEIVFTSVAGVTGILMMLIILAMGVTSTAAVRRSSYETFWYTHHLFIFFFILLFVHDLGGVLKHQVNLKSHPPGCKMIKKTTNMNDTCTSPVKCCFEAPVFEADRPEAWLWCIIPFVIYVVERLVRAFRSYQSVELVEVLELADKVVEVKMKKHNFTAKPGQFVYINCTDVSRFEWHPFTLTQCPFQDKPTFSIHFKISGDWTEKFAERLLSTTTTEIEKKQLVCMLQNEQYCSYVRPNLKVAVDGPFGSPTMDVWRYDVSLCIATGIGVTPFAALINELRNKGTTTSSFKLRRVYFVWVCRHVQSFQWFMDLLHSTYKELWENNRPDFLICNFYVTGQGCEDQVVTSKSDGWLSSRLHYNRPIWRTVFERVSRENPKTCVGVFYCGNSKVTTTLKKNCERFYPTRTKFIFNKEVLS